MAILLKIHMLTDDHSNPLDFGIAAGQVSDYEIIEALLKGKIANYVLAYKGYDRDEIRFKPQ